MPSSKLKSKLFIIHAGTYPYDIVCFFGDDKKPLLQKIKYSLTASEYVEVADATIKHGRVYIFQSGVSLLWLPKVPKTIEELGHLNHEIFHAVDEILRRIGIELTGSSCEAYAYLLEYVSVKIWSELKINIK